MHNKTISIIVALISVMFFAASVYTCIIFSTKMSVYKSELSKSSLYSIWMVGIAGHTLFYDSIFYTCQRPHCYMLRMTNGLMCIMDLDQPVNFNMKPNVMADSCTLVEYPQLFNYVTLFVLFSYMAGTLAYLVQKLCNV